jgi:5-formyltetrahydrofolate cyclo-ligase
MYPKSIIQHLHSAYIHISATNVCSLTQVLYDSRPKAQISSSKCETWQLFLPFLEKENFHRWSFAWAQTLTIFNH